VQPESDESESASKIPLRAGVDAAVFRHCHGGRLDPLEHPRHCFALGFVKRSCPHVRLLRRRGLAEGQRSVAIKPHYVG
jgi:hypothetical protein